jgi:hypothetical protein
MISVCYICQQSFTHNAGIEPGGRSCVYICIPCLRTVPDHCVYNLSTESIVNRWEKYSGARLLSDGEAITKPNIDRAICQQCRGFHP